MKIKLTNYGCYSKKSYTFDNNFTLLNGKNGSGKSTVFHAICYALYGKHKSVKYGCTSSTVEVINSDCRIIRTSKPVKLKYITDKEYEGDKAQAMIEQYYGMNWEQFNLCAWINSTEKASIATITPMERYNVIRTMVCNNVETLADVEKISRKETELEKSYNELRQECAMYEEMIKDFDDFEKPSDVEIPDDIDIQIEELESQLDELRNTMSKSDIEKRINDIKERPQLVDKLQHYKALLNYENKVLAQRRNAEEFAELRKRYFKDIQDRLDKNRKKLNSIDVDNLKLRMQENTQRMIARDRKNPYWDKDPKDIALLLDNSMKELVTPQMRNTYQKCPHCDKSVCIDGNTVLPWNRKYANSGDYLTQEQLEYLQELSELEYPYSNTDAEFNELSTLKNSITEYTKILQGEILSSELVRLNKSIGSNIRKPSNYSKYTIRELEGKIEELHIQIGGIDEESSDELQTLHKMLKSNASKMDVNTIKSRLSKLRELQSIHKSQIQYNVVKNKLQNIQSKLHKSEKELDAVIRDKNAIQILKTRQKEAEILSMQNILNTINAYSKKYLDMFFTNNITVNISMIKKTAKTTKMSLEMNCEYNGYTYTDIRNFSQGELIKINLAFIFALNQLSNSKFLLLDEVMSNIDKDLIGDIYEIIREISRDRQILVIDHNAVEGSFDCIVEF